MRKCYWRYEAGLQREVPGLALRFGSAWHRAMDARAGGADFEAALAAAVPAGCGETLDELAIATLSALLAAYYSHYGSGAADAIPVTRSEVEFRHPLDGSRTFEVAGKIDGLAGEPGGAPCALVERKTTSDNLDPDSDYWLRLRADTQLLQYVPAARLLGFNVTRIVYDVVRKPQIEPRNIPQLDADGCKQVVDAAGARVFLANGKPRQAGDPDKGWRLLTAEETPAQFAERLVLDIASRPTWYFARREVPILDQDVEAFEVQRLVLSRIILHARQAQKALARPENAWPRHVDQLGCGRCDYCGFCLQNVSPDLAHPPAGFRVGPANPELSQSPQPAPAAAPATA
jgi:hypothetical protein